MKQSVAIMMCSLLMVGGVTHAADQLTVRQHVVWDDKPADRWQHAYPLGNGRLGAMTFGDYPHEKILLNDETIWVGRRSPQNQTDIQFIIEEIREDLFAGRIPEANRKVNEDFLEKRVSPRSFVPMGFLHIEYDADGDKQTKDYRRSLVLNNGVAITEFDTANGNRIRQETFSSRPDDVIVVRIESKNKKGLSFKLSMDRYAHFETGTLDDHTLEMFGQAQALDDQIGTMGKLKGTRWHAVVRVVPEGGSAKAAAGAIHVDKADAVTLLIASSTDYNYRKTYLALRHDRQQTCLNTLAAAEVVPFKTLKARHKEDFQHFFPRATIDLGTSSSELLAQTTPNRLQAHRDGSFDPDLMEDLFQMGRYLLISASRPGTLPPNLTGIWNANPKPKCHSDFHLNIAIQEAYWHCEVANLSELHEPYITFIDDIRLNQGRQLAEKLGCRGFLATHATHGWKEAVFQGNAQWGMWPMGGAWSAEHVMEHFRFTQDKTYLKETALPILKDNVLFLLDWLVPHPETGKLVSGPSTSPENSFHIDDTNNKYEVCMGPAMDQMIAYESFTDFLEAAKVLGIEEELAQQVAEARDTLARPQITSDGRLMEWDKEYREWQPAHRHLSHLYAVHPGCEITPEGTPELAAAASKSLHFRLEQQDNERRNKMRYSKIEGWSRAHAFNIFARLHEGEEAYKAFRWLMHHKTLPNLMHQEPPIYFDGSGAGSAGMVELLVQSHTGVIHLLPALPEAWADGAVRGICARGAFEVDMEWKNGNVVSAKILSKAGGPCKVRIGDKVIEIQTEAGQRYTAL